MGLNIRPTTGRIANGSRLIVAGQPTTGQKVFPNSFNSKTNPYDLTNEQRDKLIAENKEKVITPTPSVTPTNTPTPSIPPTSTPTPYTTPTSTFVPTSTPTPTVTSTMPVTPSVTPSHTPTPAIGNLINPILTEENDYIVVGDNEYLMFVDPIILPTPTPTPTLTQTPTPTPTLTQTPTITLSPSVTPTSSSLSLTPTPTPTITKTPTNTPSITPTTTPTNTPTNTITPTETPTPSPTSSSYSSLFNLYINEVGSDVIMSGTGNFNTTDLTFVLNRPLSGFITPNTSEFFGGTSGSIPVNSDLYSGSTLVTPSNLGTSGVTVSNSGGGSSVGVFKTGRSLPVYTLALPTGYISLTTISTIGIFTGTTLNTLGLTSGTYTYTWGTGPNTGALVVYINS